MRFRAPISPGESYVVKCFKLQEECSADKIKGRNSLQVCGMENLIQDGVQNKHNINESEKKIVLEQQQKIVMEKSFVKSQKVWSGLLNSC